MSFEEFVASTQQPAPPPVGDALKALWYDRKGDWGRAHLLAQNEDSPAGAWVHAYLHRKEGDDGNASYWYLQAGRPDCDTSLELEWEAIARALLA